MKWQEVVLTDVVPDAIRLPEQAVEWPTLATAEEAARWLAHALCTNQTVVRDPLVMRWVVDNVLLKLFPCFSKADLDARLVTTPFGGAEVKLQNIILNLPQVVVYDTAAWF